MGNEITPKGFGLIEILISLGLLGIIIASIATLFFETQRSIHRLDNKIAVNSVSMDIQGRLASSELCSFSMSGAQPFNYRLAEQSSVNSDYPGLPVQFYLSNGETVKAQESLQGFPVFVEHISLINAELAGSDLIGRRIYKTDLYAAFSTEVNKTRYQHKPRVLGSLFVKVNEQDAIVECVNMHSEVAKQNFLGRDQVNGQQGGLQPSSVSQRSVFRAAQSKPRKKWDLNAAQPLSRASGRRFMRRAINPKVDPYQGFRDNGFK